LLNGNVFLKMLTYNSYKSQESDNVMWQQIFFVHERFSPFENAMNSNISSLHFASYFFSKVPFTLTRTRSPMWYLAFRPCFLFMSLFYRWAIFSRGTCVFSRHNRRLRSGGRMSCMIVSTHDILQNIEVALCIFMDKITSHSLFQHSVEARRWPLWYSDCELLENEFLSEIFALAVR